MDPVKRKALEAAGWQIGDAADFLEMSAQERQLLDARVQLARAVRSQRLARGWSQKALAARLETSQPRVAKIEQAAADVSLDQLVRAFALAGGKLVVRTTSKNRARTSVQLQLQREQPSKSRATREPNRTETE
jgi:transcriptional regulator with XRE-family HTH domain